MKTGVLTILMLLSLSAIILNVGPLLTRGEITRGERVYENIREMNADTLPVTVNQEDGRELVRFVKSTMIREWRVRCFLVAVSFLVFAGLLSVIVVESREKTKGKKYYP